MEDDMVGWMEYTVIIIGLFFLILFVGFFSVRSDYLGVVNESIGSEEWVGWHYDRLANSSCVSREVLNTVNCCGGHVTVYCERFPWFVYFWWESHAVKNSFNSKFFWE